MKEPGFEVESGVVTSDATDHEGIEVQDVGRHGLSTQTLQTFLPAPIRTPNWQSSYASSSPIFAPHVRTTTGIDKSQN